MEEGAMMFPYWSLGGGMMLAALVWSIVLVVLALLMLWRAGQDVRARVETPLQIAQRRYARGEITRKEFEELRHVLTKPAHFAG
jgi:uncharacterized membrane protein